MILTISGCFIHSAQAVTMNGCGDYQIEGFVRKEKSSAIIVINEKSVSEVKIKAAVNWQSKLFAYADQPIKAQIKITKKMDGTRAVLSSIKEIELRTPDPLKNNFEKITLIKKGECQ